MKKLPVFLLVFLILMAMAVPSLAAYRVYRVQPQNTVSQIAVWYGLTRLHWYRPTGYLIRGLSFPARFFFDPRSRHRADEQLHLVKPGETLQDLAARYNTSLKWRWTVITCQGVPLYAGQMLKVPAAPKLPPWPGNRQQGGNSATNSYVWNIPALMARHPGRAFLNGRQTRGELP